MPDAHLLICKDCNRAFGAFSYTKRNAMMDDGCPECGGPIFPGGELSR